MRFLISLFSSLFLHSSKPPAVVGFLWVGGGVVSGLRVDGRTGTQEINVNCAEMEEKTQQHLIQMCRVLTVLQEFSE